MDLDLGNYERYLDVTLSRDNNITTGKIYREVIDKEVRRPYRVCTSQVLSMDAAAEGRLPRQDCSDCPPYYERHSGLD